MLWWKHKKKNVPDQPIDNEQRQICQLPPIPPSLPVQQAIEQQGQLIEELREDLTELQQRYIIVENDYYARQRNSKSSNGTLTLVAAICGIALVIILILFFKSQGGLPDFSNLFMH